MTCLKVTVAGIVNEYCTVEGNADCFTYLDTQYEPCCETKEKCPLPLKDWPSKVCIEQPEAVKDGKPVTTKASATATLLKEILHNNGQGTCLDYATRLWGLGKGSLFTGEATFYADTDRQICAHRAAADTKVECTIEISENIWTGCGGLLVGTARLSTRFHQTICKEQK